MTEDSEEICGSEVASKPGNVCTNVAKYIDGRCGFHTDSNVKKSTSHTKKHGLYQKRSNYYNDLSKKEQAWIDMMIQSFLDEAPFDESHYGKVEMLRQIAIDFHKRRSANDYIREKGLTQKKTAVAGEAGVIKEDEENVLNIAIDRLGRTNCRMLKDLGVLGNEKEESRKEAAETLIGILSGTNK